VILYIILRLNYVTVYGRRDINQTEGEGNEEYRGQRKWMWKGNLCDKGEVNQRLWRTKM